MQKAYKFCKKSCFNSEYLPTLHDKAYSIAWVYANDLLSAENSNKRYIEYRKDKLKWLDDAGQLVQPALFEIEAATAIM